MARECTISPDDSPDDERSHNTVVWPTALPQIASGVTEWALESNPVDAAHPIGLVDHGPTLPTLVPDSLTLQPSWCLDQSFTGENDRSGLVEPGWVPAGPGWFDSSWILRQGLEVREIESASPQDCGFEA
jgi:hypothetical protein